MTEFLNIVEEWFNRTEFAWLRYAALLVYKASYTQGRKDGWDKDGWADGEEL